MRIDTYHLKGDTTFSIALDLGCNLFRWVMEGRSILYAPENFPRGDGDFFKGGNPILFPSVGRTWDRTEDPPVFGQYHIHGRSKTYQMPIHGLLPFAQGEKIHEDVFDDHIQVEYACLIPADVLEEHYPFNVSFRLRYTLKPASVRIEGFFENKGSTPAPFAFGCHPYFAFDDKTSLQIHLPCRERFILDPKLLVPIGREPLQSPILSLESTKTYDMGFTHVTGERASIVDSRNHRFLHIDIDSNIDAFVIYTNPQAVFICLEPWTKGLGAFETLNHKDWPATRDLMVLPPGQSQKVRLKYSVE